jgi:hypothetical protein
MPAIAIIVAIVIIAIAIAIIAIAIIIADLGGIESAPCRSARGSCSHC